tara:strand:+ start:1831 stop:2055 length:225 start_codon:yes stop_codon:yes gene_type:complete
MDKLTDEELILIQSMLSKFNQLKMQIGDAEMQKMIIIDKVDELKKEYEKIEKDLADKYGAQAQINVQTGEVVKK